MRLPAIDHLRGLIMILMALDHTRDYFSNAHFNPLDLDQTTPGLFLTRWITHFLRASLYPPFRNQHRAFAVSKG